MTNKLNTTISDFEAALLHTLDRVRAIRNEAKESPASAASRLDETIEDIVKASRNYSLLVRSWLLNVEDPKPVVDLGGRFANPDFTGDGQVRVDWGQLDPEPPKFPPSGFLTGEDKPAEDSVTTQLKELMGKIPDVKLEPLPSPLTEIESWYENDYGLHMDPGGGQEEILVTGYSVVPTGHKDITLVKVGNDHYHLRHDSLLFVKLPQPNRLPLIMLDDLENSTQLPKVLKSIALSMDKKPDAMLTNWTTGVSPSPFISFHAFN